MVTPISLLLFLVINGPHPRAAEVALPSGGKSGPDRAANLGTNLVGTSAAELGCLFRKADPEVSEKDARSTAEGMVKALEKLKLPADIFSRHSLLHFMSQVLKESGHLKKTEQIEPRDRKGNVIPLPPEKKGWGLIQVTGTEVMNACCECVNSCAAPMGTQIKASPKTTVGNDVEDRTAAALLSLCWWKMTMLNNRKHKSISNQGSRGASHKVTQIVNAGGVGNPVTGGTSNLNERSKFFATLIKVDKARVCRNI